MNVRGYQHCVGEVRAEILQEVFAVTVLPVLNWLLIKDRVKVI